MLHEEKWAEPVPHLVKGSILCCTPKKLAQTVFVFVFVVCCFWLRVFVFCVRRGLQEGRLCFFGVCVCGMTRVAERKLSTAKARFALFCLGGGACLRSLFSRKGSTMRLFPLSQATAGYDFLRLLKLLCFSLLGFARISMVLSGAVSTVTLWDSSRFDLLPWDAMFEAVI